MGRGKSSEQNDSGRALLYGSRRSGRTHDHSGMRSRRELIEAARAAQDVLETQGDERLGLELLAAQDLAGQGVPAEVRELESALAEEMVRRMMKEQGSFYLAEEAERERQEVARFELRTRLAEGPIENLPDLVVVPELWECELGEEVKPWIGWQVIEHYRKDPVGPYARRLEQFLREHPQTELSGELVRAALPDWFAGNTKHAWREQTLEKLILAFYEACGVTSDPQRDARDRDFIVRALGNRLRTGVATFEDALPKAIEYIDVFIPQELGGRLVRRLANSDPATQALGVLGERYPELPEEAQSKLPALSEQACHDLAAAWCSDQNGNPQQARDALRAEALRFFLAPFTMRT